MDRADLELTASLTRINHDVGRLVVRLLDEDRGGGLTEYTRPLGEVEHVLGLAMIKVGEMLRTRALEHGYVTVEGTAFETRSVTPELSNSPRPKPAIPEF